MGFLLIGAVHWSGCQMVGIIPATSSLGNLGRILVSSAQPVQQEPTPDSGKKAVPHLPGNNSGGLCYSFF
jgi:hypothetical protein